MAGPGLPSSVVDAFDSGKTVALLVVRTQGDRRPRPRAGLDRARHAGRRSQLFVFTGEEHLQVLADRLGRRRRPRPGAGCDQPEAPHHGGLPSASVSYGFRGPKSVVQAVEDAEYKGKTNLPYYPR